MYNVVIYEYSHRISSPCLIGSRDGSEHMISSIQIALTLETLGEIVFITMLRAGAILHNLGDALSGKAYSASMYGLNFSYVSFLLFLD